MEVRGSVTDRPWGLTLGAIALRRHTGQLTIESDNKRYCIAFDNGAFVAASSPMAADAIARVALTNHFITSTQVPDLTRRLAQAPDRDEVDVLAEAIRFSPEQVLKLRHRVVAQRAARTFSLERGEFVLDGRIALPVFAGVAVDHRHAIYLGVRTNLSEQRLLDDLRQLGTHFMLKPEALDELSRFGFEPNAQPVIDALKLGTSLPELEASHRELDPRFAQAIIYALVSCTACVIQSRTQTTPSAPRNVTPRYVTGRTATPTAGTPALAAGTTPFATPPSRTTTPTALARSATKTPPAGARTTSSPFASRTSTASPTAYAAAPQDTGTNTPAATRARTASSPGASRTTTPPPGGNPSRTAPSPALSIQPRTVTPRPTGPAPAVADPPLTGRVDTEEAVRFVDIPTPSPLPASAKAAATFSEPRPKSITASRPAVPRVMTPNDADALRGFGDQRTPSGFIDQRTPGFGDQRTPLEQRTPTGPTPSRVSTDSATAADEAFKRGEAAMKRDQPGEAILEFKTACDLNPVDVDYAAMLGWAKFCAAGDKPAIGADTRKVLERAVFKSQKPERARFYLGRVERMLGRDKEALRHFNEVLELKPNHAEAASEVRAIEARLQAASKGGTGLFGRKR
jgi:Tetratricopeptide repeat